MISGRLSVVEMPAVLECKNQSRAISAHLEYWFRKVGNAMSIQPIDLPTLIGSVAWPVVSAMVIVVLRQPAADIVSILAERINKVSVGGVSLELAALSKLRPRSLESERRELASAPPTPSAAGALLFELRVGGAHDFILIDLGSQTAPRWLTSRLYLFAVMLSRVSRIKCFVFVETAAEIRNRFVGIATPDAVRWALARRYLWLEQAYSWEYAQIGLPQFDAVPGVLSLQQVNQIISRFTRAARISRSNVKAGNPPGPRIHDSHLQAGSSKLIARKTQG
jgi:hypothetical protein